MGNMEVTPDFEYSCVTGVWGQNADFIGFKRKQKNWSSGIETAMFRSFAIKEDREMGQ